MINKKLNIRSVNIFKNKSFSLKDSNYFFEKEEKKIYKIFENVNLTGSFWKNDTKIKKKNYFYLRYFKIRPSSFVKYFR